MIMDKFGLIKENFLNWMFFKSPILSKYFRQQIRKIEIKKWIDKVNPIFLEMIDDDVFSDRQKLILYGNFPSFVYGKGKDKKTYQKYATDYLMRKYPDIFKNSSKIEKFFELY